MRKQTQLSLVVLILISTFSIGFAARPEVGNLTCEYLVNPVGINATMPRLSWKMTSAENEQFQTAYQLIVASSPELLNAKTADLWNSGKIESSQSILVSYEGKELLSRQKCWWKLKIWDKNGKSSNWSEMASFEIGLLHAEDWTAEWINPDCKTDKYIDNCPLLRNEFNVVKKIKEARLYCTSLGLYQVYLNGKKVSDDLFTPGWTSFKNRVQYQTYDVSDMLINGGNAVAVLLGNGWYRDFRPNGSEEDKNKDLKLLAQIEIVFTDGSKQIVNTDNSWKSFQSPILSSTIYNGEVYDARLEKDSWNLFGFNDDNFEKVIISKERKDNINAPNAPAVRRIEEIHPLNILYTPDGDTVFDMGQNMVGWCRLNVDCSAGTTIKLKHAEVLDSDGNFYTKNLRTAKQEITYICKGGEGMEVYEPHFTFQGFRYVSISGYSGEVSKDILTGIVIHSDLERTGSFSCNNDTINQLQHNIIWGQKGNFLDVPTDCPQRDERLGWTGDAQVFAPTACFNMNCAGFYTEWLKDMAADQSEDGSIPWVVPDKIGLGAAHGWADAAVIVPWTVYRYFGDTQILANQYESMKAWVGYMSDKAGASYLWKPEVMQFGDWLAFATTRSDYPGATTDKDLLANAYFYHSADLMSKIASILDKDQDAAFYENLKVNIKKSFNEEYVTPKGRLSSNTQTAYVVALSFGLLPKDKELLAAERLADDVNSFGHITTGFLGTPDICHMLTEYGYIDEAFKLLYRKDYPSWLYPISKGATTIWERWDGQKPDGSFQNTDMNSFNHYAYGAVGDWLYSKVAGIDLNSDVPGFKEFTLKPHPGNKMNNVKASHESPYGTIISEWLISDANLEMKVTIPVNTSAQICVPSTGEKLFLDGKEITVDSVIPDNGLGYQYLVVSKGSGSYVFSAKLNNE